MEHLLELERLDKALNLLQQELLSISDPSEKLYKISDILSHIAYMQYLTYQYESQADQSTKFYLKHLRQLLNQLSQDYRAQLYALRELVINNRLKAESIKNHEGGLK